MQWWGMGRALGAGQNLKEFDIDNKYGAAAVKQVLNSIIACTQGHEASAVTTTEVRHARAGSDDDGAVVRGVVSGIPLSHGSGARALGQCLGWEARLQSAIQSLTPGT